MVVVLQRGHRRRTALCDRPMGVARLRRWCRGRRRVRGEHRRIRLGRSRRTRHLTDRPAHAGREPGATGRRGLDRCPRGSGSPDRAHPGRRLPPRHPTIRVASTLGTEPTKRGSGLPSSRPPTSKASCSRATPNQREVWSPSTTTPCVLRGAGASSCSSPPVPFVTDWPSSPNASGTSTSWSDGLRRRSRPGSRAEPERLATHSPSCVVTGLREAEPPCRRTSGELRPRG